MTYEFFKQEVRKLGLHFRVLDEAITVGNVKHINTSVSGLYFNEFEAVCNVHIKERFSLYQTYRFYKLEESLQEKLFDLVNELARTPIDERGDPCKEHKWYLKHKYLNTYTGKNYLKHDKRGTDLLLGGKAEGMIWVSKFTRYEIEELASRINLNEFEKEEVE